MKKNPLKEKSPAELTKMLAQTREELRNLRFAAAGSRPADTNAPAKARKQIAQILTELGARNVVA